MDGWFGRLCLNGVILCFVGVCCLGCGGQRAQERAYVEEETPVAKVRQPVPGLLDYPIGGDFTLTDDTGQPFRFESLRGRVVLLFFGYTMCPDACPQTLSRLRRVFDMLEVEEDRLVAVYVSVDPERDTPEKLHEYLGYFGVPSVGLTGTVAEVDSVVSLYGVTYEKTDFDSEAGYLINHTIYVYLVDPDGKVRYRFRPEDSPEMIASMVRRLL